MPHARGEQWASLPSVLPPTAMTSLTLFTPPAPARLARYLHERFPLGAYGPLVAVFAGAGVAVGGGSWSAVLPAALSLLAAFLLLRIADEHKDVWTDARYRPHRPVPRGLVTLRELRALAGVGVGVQAAVALTSGPMPVVSLLLVWGYAALMAVEFGNPAWLRARPALYLATHLGILPLLVLHAATFGAAPDARALVLLMAAAYAAGVVLEVGRKLRAPADEQVGVETYTAAWGRRRAVGLWLVGLITSGLCVGPLLGVWSAVLVVLAEVAAVLGWRFVRTPSARAARRLEHVSAAWLLTLFLLVALRAPF